MKSLNGKLRIESRILIVTLAILITISSHSIVNIEAATSSKSKPKQYVYFKDKHHLEGGVGKSKKDQKRYWISSGLSGFMYNCAKDAMLNWTNNASYINFYITSKRPESVVDIYGSYDGKELGYNAYTVFRKSWFSSVDPDESNWKYGQIYYNLDNGLEKKDRKKIIAVYAHEIGHCFGLDENNTNKKSIMCQAAYGRSVTSVQSCGFEGIKKLYK